MEAAGPSSTSMAVVNQGIISDPEEEYSLMDLPPGYRFHPTDEEIISHYLTPKVNNSRFVAVAIAEVDLNKCEPWDLPKRAKMGEKEMYFFCNRDRKYPTGMRTNRATECGYWKATGKDKEIYKQPVPGSGSRPGRRCLIGMRKTLVFYKGRAPKGEKTNWVMHEYRLEGQFSYYNFPNKDEWVVSRVFHKSSGMKRSPIIFPTGMNPYGNNDHHQLLEYCSNISLLPPLVENPTRPSLIDEDECTDGDGDYLSYLSVNLEDHPPQNRNINHSTPQTYNQIGPIEPDHSSNFYPQSQLPINHEYLQQEILPDTNQAILRALKGARMSSEFIEKQCKMEQLSSNQSMISVSQDTGLSTDITAETSSRPSNRVYNLADIEDPNSAGPNVSDGLDYFWDY